MNKWDWFTYRYGWAAIALPIIALVLLGIWAEVHFAYNDDWRCAITQCRIVKIEK